MEQTSLGCCSRWITDQLAPLYGKNEATAMSRILVEELLHYSPVDVVVHKDKEILPSMGDKIEKAVKRLLDGEPIQYILGKGRFYGADIYVTPDVLIPRQETEELVDMIVRRRGGEEDLDILDLCTGSGGIAVTLARVMKFPSVTGLDLSAPALEVARKNAVQTGVKVKWIEGDVLDLDRRLCGEEFDIIVSNPPYIMESEAAEMEANVLAHEPAMALFVPDSDPLVFYRAITIFAAAALKPEGELYLEINPLCEPDLIKLIRSSGFRDVESHLDISGRRRFITAKSPKEP